MTTAQLALTQSATSKELASLIERYLAEIDAADALVASRAVAERVRVAMARAKAKAQAGGL